MKRSPLRRRRPLAPGQRPKPKPRRASAVTPETREAIRLRSGGRCEAAHVPDCPGRGAEAHHVRNRSQGGSHEAAWLLWVCRADHRWITDHPAEAWRLGLTARQGDTLADVLDRRSNHDRR